MPFALGGTARLRSSKSRSTRRAVFTCFVAYQEPSTPSPNSSRIAIGGFTGKRKSFINRVFRSWAASAAFASTANLVLFDSAIAQKTNGHSRSPITSRRGVETNAALDSQQIPLLPPGLRDAPERLIVGELVLRLQAYVYRDFMPLATSHDAAGLAARANHTSMIAGVTLTDEHGALLPATLHAKTIWILQGESVWETSTIEERRNGSNAPSCEFVVRSGPKWQPGSAVDVVIRLTDGNGRTFLLAIRHQVIDAAQ
jgi:hypothetical protein